MAKPVINPITSLPGYRQWQAWIFQPWASGLSANPQNISWSSSALPPGMELDTATGQLSGAVTVPGVYTIGIQVNDTTAGYGLSDPLTFGVAIREAIGNDFLDTDLWVDVTTGAVTAGSPGASGGSAGSAAGGASGSSGGGSASGAGTASGYDVAPLFSAKMEDDRILYVRFHKGGDVVDLGELSALKYALKEFDPDAEVVVSGAFGQLAQGSDAVYGLHIHFTGNQLAGALSNYMADGGTAFDGLAELRWAAANPTNIGPATLQRASNTFRTLVSRNIAS